MLTLKGYQQRAIDTLDNFLSRARDRQNVTDAYAEALQNQGLPPLAYRDYGFADVPYVCFRIPTGGGKTLLASHAIVTAAKSYLDADFPITLWLVPSNTIRQQTVEALKKPGHPYREPILQSSFASVQCFLNRHNSDKTTIPDNYKNKVGAA